MVHRSDRTSSCHQLDIRCEGRAQARLAEPADRDSALVRDDGNQAVAAWAAAPPSAESSWSPCSVESLERDVQDVTLIPIVDRDGTRM